MKMYKLKCPYCKADLLEQDGLETFYCKYCGGKIILTGQNEDVLRYKIREKDSARRTKEKNEDLEREFRRANQQIEIERRKDNANLKSALKYFALAFAAIFLLIIFIYISDFFDQRTDKKLEVLYNEVQVLIEDGKYDEAMQQSEGLKGGSSNRNWDVKRTALQQQIRQAQLNELEDKTFLVPLAAKDFVRMNYKDAVSYFENAGFIYVTAVQSSKPASFFSKGNEVSSVSIDGVSNFEAATYFPLDAKIVITYDTP